MTPNPPARSFAFYHANRLPSPPPAWRARDDGDDLYSIYPDALQLVRNRGRLRRTRRAAVIQCAAASVPKERIEPTSAFACSQSTFGCREPA